MKVGIVTQYYKSINYGGNLQAYALYKFLEYTGVSAEQISYKPAEEKKTRNIKSLYNWVRAKSLCTILYKLLIKARTIAYKPMVKILYSKQCHKLEYTIQKRIEKFHNFNSILIPHSDKVYSDENIIGCLTHYDVFITGSDQVWNVNCFHNGYFLTFVPWNKKKISYAASIAMPSLSLPQKKYFEENIKDFDAISVREASAVDLIRDLVSIPIEVVVDPTLLLSENDWNEVCAEKLIEWDYVFCYFLGNNKKSREICKQYAKKHNLKIVNIPMAKAYGKFVDQNFGDIEYNASPEEFLSLIRYANYIFTDSFHAVIFSNIYKKQYYIFKRNKQDTMSSRIYDITKLFNTEKRYCSDTKKESLQYIESLPDITYENNEHLRIAIQNSKDYLKRNVIKNEKSIKPT